MVFKVLVRSQPSPAKFQIIYREQADTKIKPDLKIFCSTHVKEPRENNCAKAFSNVKLLILKLQPVKFAIGSADKNEFNVEYIYLTFFSLTGCSITVTVNFGDPNATAKGKG